VHAPDDAPRDYYAVLQVDPGADQEVIEAAYRQLMKKHHPDLAGDDPRRIAEHLATAKVLNEAYSVLRNPEQRRRYDYHRSVYGWQRPPSSASQRPGSPPPASARQPSSSSGSRSNSQSRAWASSSHSQPTSSQTGSSASPPPGVEAASQVQADAEPSPGESVILRPTHSDLPGPLALFSAAYYLLPGPYEWEEGSRKELLTVGLLPVAGVAGFALFTGRLAPWIGTSLNATLVGWGLIVLLCLPMLNSLPRVAMAGIPSLVLLSGTAAPFLAQIHVPVWFAWGMASLVSVVLAARLFVFGVLPTVAACWLVTQIT